MEQFLTKITENAICLSEYQAFLADESCGSENYFSGIVRATNKGKQVIGITYDVHWNIAEQIMKDIVNEVLSSFGDNLRVFVVHRVGHVLVGETCILIGVSAPHRVAAFSGCRYIIEEVKRRISIWKKEYYANGAYKWLEGTPLKACGGMSDS